MIPVLCLNCGMVVGNKKKPYDDLLASGKTSQEAMKILRIQRKCCRIMIHCSVDNTEKQIHMEAVRENRQRKAF
jgi:DNA-directed RNA polymerase subunit N (RpoN/RPB10)